MKRVQFGLYWTDTPEAVALELHALGTRFVRLFEAIDPPVLGREVQYGFPAPTQRSLAWMG